MMKYPVLFLLSVVASIVYQQEALSQMIDIKSRAPIRTWAGSELCLCPYDQVVTSGLSLTFPDEVYTCGSTSAWSRTGGREPACYLGDRQQRSATSIERQCRELGFNQCYVDIFNRF